MFNIFKKKTYLRDCIPLNYTDIHSHTLFGIDDGAKTIEDSSSLLNQMLGLGFNKIITTPHTISAVYPNTTEIIQNKFKEVKASLSELTNKISYQAASEYMIDESFQEKVKNNDLLPLKDNYILVEMSYINPPIFLENALFALQSKGYIPVLAHPERYNFYKGELEPYKRLKKIGCKFQLNLLSVTGYYGTGPLKTAQKLLNEGMYDFTGSDIHHQRHIDAFSTKVLIKNIDSLKNLLNNNTVFK